MRIVCSHCLVLCLACLVAVCAGSCEGKKANGREINYDVLKDSLNIENYDPLQDTANLFDDTIFIPGFDSVENLLIRIDTLWKVESDMLSDHAVLKKVAKKRQTFTVDDSLVLIENIQTLDSFLLNKNHIQPGNCREKECVVYAEVVKPLQKLYLYIDGTLVDSFKVSTGIKGFETPEMNVRPSGPVLTRYTSRKFPGGNYQGLGNMPYAVFLRGGYAIHGTTAGNFSKLGRTASHGCIRLHPNNARIFNELVKRAGLENTWVKVTNNMEAD